MLGTADPLWQKASQKAPALGQDAALDSCASRVAGEVLNKNLLMPGSFRHNGPWDSLRELSCDQPVIWE